jgi:Domain of unknown function (DUF1841)
VFNPSQDEVRRFFCSSWSKHLSASPLTPLEALALDWILEHPEYHSILGDETLALQTVFSVDQGKTNPFLHLSMHLAIAEQISIDQPPGVTGIFQQLAQRQGSPHLAAHAIMESLGEVIWEAQRSGTAPDTDKYLDSMKRRLGKASP